MPNFVVECDSGVVAVVRASSLRRAQAEWDAAVRAYAAEPGLVRHPQPGEVREIARDGEHDYRY